MTKRFKTCILHIGTEKTGTSTVQSFLNLNRNNLIKDGILFPVTTLTQQGSQWEFVAAIHNTPWTMDIGEACGISNEQDQRIFRQSFTKDLNRQFSQCVHADTLLISSEHFHSRLSTEQMISDLKTFLLPWVDSFKIIVYFRRQDELSMSYYSTRIKSGEPKTSLLLPQSGPEMRYFDFIWIYKSWAKYFGKDAIFARLYQRNKQGNYGILEDFCNLCNISLNGKIMPLWLNTSLNAKGLALVNAMHRYFKENRRYVSESLFQQILYEISNEFSGKFYPASREQAQLFYSFPHEDFSSMAPYCRHG